jgi:hypothetical protein
MGPKMLSLRDNRLKILPATKGIGWNFLRNVKKYKGAMYNLQKIVKISHR